MIVFCAAAAVPSRAEPWKAVPQPDLQRALDAAPAAKVEILGPAVRSVQPWSTNLVPNPDGKTWDILQWYMKAYRQKTRVYITDLSTGETTLQWFPECEGKVRPESSSWVLHWDGKLYGASPDWSKWRTGGAVNIYVYDPAKNRIELFKVVPGVGGERHQLLLGPDGKLYGTGTYLAQGDPENGLKATAYSLDPKTGTVRSYGPVGPSHAPNGCFGYWMGADDTHIYIASGKIPWWLVALEIKTGNQKVLLKAPPGDYPSRMRIWPMAGGARAWVRTGEGDDPGRHYWLSHGRAIPRKDPKEKPPWTPIETPWSKAPPRPEIYKGQITPDENGRAMLWYRLPGDAAKAPARPAADARPEDLGWRKIVFEHVESHPLKVHRLVALPDGRLFGTAQAYKGRFLYDARTRRLTRLGRGGRSPYAFVFHRGKVWWSGYSSAPIYAFDPARPWTLEKGGPPNQPPPRATDPASNPRLVSNVFIETRVKKMMSAAVGADGRIYFGGVGQRDYTGGGFGWYDPATGEKGGMWRPFSAYRIHWLAPAQGGRFIVISTRAARDELNKNVRPESAKVFIYDTKEKRIVRDFVPVPGAKKAGPLVEVAPGRLLGTTEDPATPGSGLLYGVALETGRVLFTKKVPLALRFPWSQGTAQWDFQRGPDGRVYTYLGDVLVRIHPEDVRVEVLGKVGPPGRFCFLNGHLYLAGADVMRRLTGLAGGERRKVR